MQIHSINSYQRKNTTNMDNLNNVSFKGFHGNGKALFVGDLDGTVALGAKEHLVPFLKLLKECQARLVFASGRSLEKFSELQADLASKKAHLPTPEFLITQNGSHIYQNINGKLVEDQEWSDRLAKSFDREKVLASIKELAFKPEFLMPNAKLNGAEDFSQSKLCTFEFWPTPRRLQFVADSSISETIFREIKDKLRAEGLSARVIRQFFTKEENDVTCNAAQRAIMEPRYGKNNYITQIDITAANKGDGVEFLQNKFKVRDKEVVMAGNDSNDISMAKLALSDRTFIGVGNRTEPLEIYMLNLLGENRKLEDKLILPKKEGLSGIIEAINKMRARN